MSVRELEPWSRKGKSPICGLSNEQEVEVRNLISRPCLDRALFAMTMHGAMGRSTRSVDTRGSHAVQRL